VLIALPLAIGCGKSAAPPVEGRLAIENIAKWRQMYVADHGNKPPADEAAFLNFIDGKLKERGEAIDREAFLVSPRDGQKFIVQYGKDSAGLSATSVVVHEQEGYGGKVLVAVESARSSEIDAAELPALLAAEP
jgi:hypothetical protein